MRTVGVEEELLIVDPTTGQPLALGSLLVGPEATQGTSGAPGGLQHELQEQQLEIDTRPFASLADLAEDLRHWRATADLAATKEGARVAALATSPLAVAPTTVPSVRYQTMAERFALLEREQLTCGCHIHVSVDCDEEAVAVIDRIRVWLPILTALSSNSPFWQGKDTGYASYRSMVWARWPSSGPIEVQGSIQAYRRLVDDLLRSGSVMDAGMVYFDARISATYPTVEVRVCDVCLRLEDAVVLAGLVRALVDTAADEWRQGRPPPDVPAGVVRGAAWHAARWGLGADLVHPQDGMPRPAAEVVADLVSHVAPALEYNGDAALVTEGLRQLLARGSGADRQRLAAHGSVADLAAVVRDAVERTQDGSALPSASAPASPASGG